MRAPEAAIAGREQQPLVIEALERIRVAGAGSVAPPAVGPVVVAGNPHQRPLERVEPRERGRVEILVGAGAVATGLHVAVEGREGDVVRVDVGEQGRVLGLAERVVGHVSEQADRVPAVVTTSLLFMTVGPAGGGAEREHGGHHDGGRAERGGTSTKRASRHADISSLQETERSNTGDDIAALPSRRVAPDEDAGGYVSGAIPRSARNDSAPRFERETVSACDCNQVTLCDGFAPFRKPICGPRRRGDTEAHASTPISPTTLSAGNGVRARAPMRHRTCGNRPGRPGRGHGQIASEVWRVCHQRPCASQPIL